METQEIFKFDDDEILNHIKYELRLLKRMKKGFDYVYDKLVKAGNHYALLGTKDIDLQQANYSEGKNYNWLALSCGDMEGSTEFVIRQYGQHFTIFTKLTSIKRLSGQQYQEFDYGCFSFNTETKGLTGKEHDRYCDNPHIELNKAFPVLIDLVTDGKVNSVWNDISFPRPSYCEVQTAFYGETIRSIDLLVFAAEELSDIYMSLFAENEMLDMVKAVAEKQKEIEAKHESLALPFDRNSIVKRVVTEFPKQYSEPYYHGVGIEIIKTDDRPEFIDVYSLTRWYLKEVQNIIE